MLGLCLVAVFALGVVIAASASAKLPEWGKCHRVEVENAQEEIEFPEVGGKYTDSNCTVKARAKQGVFQGEYEWKEATGNHAFQGEELSITSGVFTFEMQSGEKIECASVGPESLMGGLGGSEAKTPLWIFQNCTSEGKGCATLSIGSFPGEVANVLEWLEEEGRGWKGQLGYVEGNQSSPSPAVGLGFTSDNSETGEHERFFVPIVCEGSIGTVWIGGERKGRNSVIGTIGPVNQMGTQYSLTYSESAPGIQQPEKFANKNREVLQAFLHGRWEPVAFNGQLTFTTGKAEIKATR
jgi:hypothetical protein